VTDVALADILASAQRRPKTVSVFGPDPYPDLEDALSVFDVELRHEYLPVEPRNGYLTVREGDRVLGSVTAAGFADLATPVDRPPWDDRRRQSSYRELVDMLANTTFQAADRSQLLATSREFEDRAYRTGTGTIHVGFQSRSAFQSQKGVYEHMAAETDLDVHVYVDDGWDVDGLGGVVVHAEPAEEIGRYWFVAYDGGGDEDSKCGLLAFERSPGEFEGVWSYDSGFVDDLGSYLSSTYG
jgi:hypothetical protein